MVLPLPVGPRTITMESRKSPPMIMVSRPEKPLEKRATSVGLRPPFTSRGKIEMPLRGDGERVLALLVRRCGGTC